MPRPRFVTVACLAATAWFCADSPVSRGADPIRSQAVVSVNFDETSGSPTVTVAGNPRTFAATAINGPARVASPFWNQSGRSALRFDAAKKQLVQLSDIPYLDRPDAATLSFFYLNLNGPSDRTVHGIVAKRSSGARGTNYAISYTPAGDLFEIFVNDGRGDHRAQYSARQVLGFRRLVYLTATFEVGDAPPPDADKDRDDVLVRLFVNGEPVAPKSVSGGQVSGSGAWFTNLNIAGLLNDAPLTLGSSTADTEHASGLIDDFLLFARALSPAEAHRLFLEAAGPNGPELAQRELRPIPRTAVPNVESVSQLGLEMGRTTRLTIRGSQLADDPHVDLPIPGLKQSAVKGSNARRFVVDVTLPADVPPGIYPLSVLTKGGISNAVGIAVDGLAQSLVGDSAADRPAALPGAFSGLLSGAGLGRVYFSGKAGARVVAEVEAKRIGSKLEPVLELKSLSGETLAIEWGRPFLRGDARVEVALPADGGYFVELHDLAYNAPGECPFRLLVGDFRAVDAYYPAVVARGNEQDVEPIGTGIPPGTVIAANLKGDPDRLAKLLAAPRKLHASGPLPPIRISDGIEILEVPQPAGQLQTIDARFAGKRHAAVAISGRLSKPGEADRYLLAVAPGRTLTLSVEARSLNSPVEGEIQIVSHPEGKPLAGASGIPGAATKGIQFTPPADTSDAEVVVRDLFGRGGRQFVYRLRILSAGQPTFNLALLDSRLNIPRNGRTVARLRVDRSSYDGPIDLKVEGDDTVSIEPKQLPAEGGSRTVLVTFLSTAEEPISAARRLRIVGKSVGLNPPIRRVAAVEAPNQAQLAGFIDSVPVASRGKSPVRIDTSALSPYLLKGVDTEWPVTAAPAANEAGRWLRLSLVSTEPPRTIERPGRRPKQKPAVTAAAEQAIPTSAGKGAGPSGLKVSVPLDLTEPAIDFVIKADVVPHAYSDRVIATTYSNPFRMLVQDAVGLNIENGNLIVGAPGKIRGKLVRHPAFKQNVTVALAGLPAGYATRPVTVMGDKTDFELPVTAANEPAARTLANVSVVVTLADGKVPIQRPIGITVSPPKK